MKPWTLLLGIFALVQWVQCALLAVDFGQEYTKAILVAPSVPLDLLLTTDTKRKEVAGVAITPVGAGLGGVIRNYGFHALNACIRNPAGCLTYVKPLLGQGNSTRFKEDHPGVEVVELRNSTGFHFGSNTFSVEEVVAMTLREIKVRAEAKWNEQAGSSLNEVQDLVLSVPRYFTQKERKSLRDAAEIAGMNLVALVDDGVAAGISYAQHRDFPESKEYHLIYDMGAGSTKATLVSFATVNDTLTLGVEGFAYDRTLGGHAFTAAIKDLLVDEFLKKNKDVSLAQLTGNSRAMNKLWRAADKAKLVLSANTETRVSAEMLYEERDFRAVITRDAFEAKVASEIVKSGQILKDALNGRTVESVILAGGSTRVPAVQKQLVDILGDDKKISKNINADEAVVFGVTFRGAGLAGYRRRRNINVVDRIERGVSLNGEVLFAEKTNAEAVSYNVTKGDVLEFAEDGTIVESWKAARNGTVQLGIDNNGLCQVTGGHVSKSGEDDLRAKELRASKRKLRLLDSEDKERAVREELVNRLESALYEARSYVEEDEVTEKGPKELVRRLKKNVDELLEWLEEKSGGSTSKELSHKLETFQKHREKLAKYVDTPDALLSLDSLLELSNSSKSVMHELQDFMVTMSEDAMRMKDVFESQEVDFAETNKQLKLDFQKETEDALQKSLDDVNTFAEKIDGLKAVPAGSPSRKHLVDLREGLQAATARLRKTHKTLESVHQLRLNFLKEKLEAVLKKRAEKKKVETSAVPTEQTTASSARHDEL